MLVTLIFAFYLTGNIFLFLGDLELNIPQQNHVIYGLNEFANSNLVKQNQEVIWSPYKRVQASSYVLIRNKPDDTYYLQVVINGQFGYGGIFKYLNKEGNEFKYMRTDGTAKDFIFVNHQLSILSKTQQYDEGILIRLLNYETSYGLKLKF